MHIHCHMNPTKSGKRKMKANPAQETLFLDQLGMHHRHTTITIFTSIFISITIPIMQGEEGVDGELDEDCFEEDQPDHEEGAIKGLFLLFLRMRRGQLRAFSFSSLG